MEMIINPYIFATVAPLAASLDFESGSSQFLSRTPGVQGNLNKATFSVWLLRESTGAIHHINSAGPSGTANADSVLFSAINTLRTEIAGSAPPGSVTSATYTSTTTWYHLLLAWDTAQAGVAKSKIQINGVTPALGTDGRDSFVGFSFLNKANLHRLGGRVFDTGATFDGLMADIRFYDGQYLDASDFGQDVAGTWSRKKTELGFAYGTNGFRIDGSGAVGTDVSGNGNSWTNNGSIVTSATIPPEV